ncbi:MAG: ABC transporter ATP-binding protein [Planctomycetota bacterium]
MTALFRASWPRERLHELLAEVGHRSGLLPRTVRLSGLPACDAEEDLWRWLEEAVRSCGVEVEPVDAAWGEVESLLAGCAPAVLSIADEGGTRFIGVLRAGRRRLRVVHPDGRVTRVSTGALRDALRRPQEVRYAEEIDRLVLAADLPPRRRRRARAALFEQRLAGRRVSGCRLLRLSPGASFRAQLVRERVLGRMARLTLCELGFAALFLGSWWLIGRGALAGRVEPGWFVAWAVALLTLVPIRATADWIQASLSVSFGVLLRRRLLHGALKMAPDEVRHRGAGSYLGQVLESQNLERLALSGGFFAHVALVELVLAALVLAAGAGGGWHVALLAGWTAALLALGWRLFGRRRRWTAARVALTHELVEKMVGHRTRLAQEPLERWHDEEDGALAGLLRRACEMDRTGAAFRSLASRGWNVLGLLALVPAVVRGTSDLVSVAVGAGGILFAAQAFQRLSLGVEQLAAAAISWREVRELYRSAARHAGGDLEATGLLLEAPDEPPGAGGLLEVDRVSFRYEHRAEPVLKDLSLAAERGARILVEGPSGEGKSTLVALLLGLHRPASGVLALRGFDSRAVAPDEWRRRVVGAPQFHDNHVLTASLAFNLLMGRRWPPTASDLDEAAAVCRELGLGELLDRMPGGLFQMVGETGWQLSHGERTRIFLARALLQDPELLVLDESFSALDPVNLQRTVDAVHRRRSAVVAIAHP